MALKVSRAAPPAAHGLEIDRTFLSVSCRAHEVPRARLTDIHRQVLDYWDGKRGAQSMPLRAMLDPGDVRLALPHLVLWDVDDGAGYRCRLAGTAVDSGMGRHLKGAMLDDLRCSLIDEARHEFFAVRDRGLISFAERTLGWIGKPHRYYRHLILPLRDAANEVIQLMSVLTFHNISER